MRTPAVFVIDDSHVLSLSLALIYLTNASSLSSFIFYIAPSLSLASPTLVINSPDRQPTYYKSRLYLISFFLLLISRAFPSFTSFSVFFLVILFYFFSSSFSYRCWRFKLILPIVVNIIHIIISPAFSTECSSLVFYIMFLGKCPAKPLFLPSIIYCYYSSFQFLMNDL